MLVHADAWIQDLFDRRVEDPRELRVSMRRVLRGECTKSRIHECGTKIESDRGYV